MGQLLKHAALKNRLAIAITKYRPVCLRLWLLMLLLGPTPAVAVNDGGHRSLEANYLAARQASHLNDLKAAATYYLAALRLDSGNPDLLQQSFATQYMLGNIDAAAALARQMEMSNLRISFASEPATAQAILREDWDAVLVLADHIDETVAARPIAAVIRAWALAAKGQPAAGIAGLLQTGRSLTTDQNGIAPMFVMQAAHLAEMAGDTDAQHIHMKVLIDRDTLPSQIILQLAAMLVRDGDSRQALNQIGGLPNGFGARQLRAMLSAQDEPMPIRSQIATAIIDASLVGNSAESRLMLPARLSLALYIDPQVDSARFFLAQALGDNGQDALVQAQLDAIGDDSVWSQPRLLMRLDIDRRTDIDAAIKRVKAALARDRENGLLFKELGDLSRFSDRFAEARDAYITARELGYESRDIDRNLAIAYERLGQDELAESHFLKALEINPNDPFSLNYLGYWWADAGRNLDQAIGLIERAVKLRPKSGYFVDSLGWVHFKLGNIDLAIGFLEKATLLEPADPVITDHLGDAYWAAGRHNEALFKWTYALSLATDDELKAQIEAKLAR